ncbi:MAG: hypothetical protein ACXVA9_01175 [Bdellovibrionales bacterium]
MRSTYFPEYRLNKPRPAPANQQSYQEQVLKNYLSATKDPKEIAKVETYGFKLVETADSTPEHNYDRKYTPSPVVDDPQEAKLRIPQGDPYRITQANYFNAGVDFRWFYLDSKTDSVHQKGMVPMATDIGASVQPFQHFTAVWESRFLSDPRTASVWDDAYTSGAGVRSAYVMADDLPYNGYAMYGIYRPMFGNENPDHTSLAAQASGLNEHAAFKSAGIGTAGNLPFFNINLLQPFENRTMSQDRGLVFNVGARFEALGSFIMLSWWDTKAKNYTTNVISSHRMQAISGGFTKGRFTFVGSVNDMLMDLPGVRRDAGTVISAEPRFRVWRESYLKGSWEYLNTSPTLRQGNAKQYGIGASSFVASGFEFEVMYKDLQSTELGVDGHEKNIWAQAHMYF